MGGDPDAGVQKMRMWSPAQLSTIFLTNYHVLSGFKEQKIMIS